jgi:hypothetical protein
LPGAALAGAVRCRLSASVRLYAGLVLDCLHWCARDQ